MIYTLENTINVGKPCRVFDGDGEEVKKCVYCDTKTGKVIRLGDYREKDRDISRITEMRPLPMKIKWSKGKSASLIHSVEIYALRERMLAAKRKRGRDWEALRGDYEQILIEAIKDPVVSRLVNECPAW